MSNPWFRMYSEAIDDEKLRLLAFEDRWHFVAILCCKNDGILNNDDPLMRRKVAVKLGVTLEELELIKTNLVKANLIDRNFQPINWHKHKGGAGFLRPSAEIWKKIRERIFLRDNYTCVYCGTRGVKLECDHVTPVSRGGTNEDSNLATSCLKCNRSKRDKLISEWSFSYE